MLREQDFLFVAKSLVFDWRKNQVFGSLCPAEDFTDAQLVAGVVAELESGTPKEEVVDKAYTNLSTNPKFYVAAERDEEMEAIETDYKVNKKIDEEIKKIAEDSLKEFLSRYRIWNDVKIVLVDSLGGMLARFRAGTELSTPIILLSPKAVRKTALKYHVKLETGVETTVMHELGHAIYALTEHNLSEYPEGDEETLAESVAHEWYWNRGVPDWTKPLLKSLKIKADQEPTQDTLVFDFDDTICKNLPNHEMGPPMEGVIERLKRAKEAGIRIIIQSGRWSVNQINTSEQAEQNRREAVEWLKKYEVPYDELRGDKEIAIGYVDDKAVPASDLAKLDHVIDKAVYGTLLTANPDEKTEPIFIAADLPDDIVERVRTWGKKNIKDEDIFTSPSDKSKPNFGREAEPHVTVVYGADDGEDGEAIETFLIEIVKAPLKARLGKISKFKTWDADLPCDVLKVTVESDDLKSLHSALKQRFGEHKTFPEFRPHVTIAYLNPQACEEMEGREDFAGTEFEINAVVCKSLAESGATFEHPVELEDESTFTAAKYDKSQLESKGYSFVVQRPFDPDRTNEWGLRGYGRVAAYYDNVEIGYLSYCFGEETTSYIRPIGAWVSPEHQRLGVATTLYNLAETDAGKLLAPSPSQSEDAKKFWENRGGYLGNIKTNVAASMVDYPHAELPTDIWDKVDDKTYKMKPKTKEGLIKVVKDMLNKVFKDAESWINALYFHGSSATQFYVDHADIDIQVIIDVAKFQAANPEFKNAKPAQALEDANEVLERHDKEAKWNNHPIELRLRDERKKADKLFLLERDALYEIFNDEWLKKPKLINHLTYSRKTTVGLAMKTALAIAENWDLALGEIRRNLEEAKVALEYFKTEPNEPKKNLDGYVNTLLRKVAASIKKLRRERKHIRRKRLLAPKNLRNLRFDLINTHPDVIVMKLLVEWGYFQKLLDLGRYAKDRDYKLKLEDAQPLLDLLEGKTHMREQDQKKAETSRVVQTVQIPGYRMDYFENGNYVVHAPSKEYPGVYDAMLADKYNSLPQEQLKLELEKDLQSWANKLTHSGVRQEKVKANDERVEKYMNEYLGKSYDVIKKAHNGILDNKMVGLPTKRAMDYALMRFYNPKTEGPQKLLHELPYPARVNMLKTIWNDIEKQANEDLNAVDRERTEEMEKINKEIEEYRRSERDKNEPGFDGSSLPLGIFNFHVVAASDVELKEKALEYVRQAFSDFQTNPESSQKLGKAQEMFRNVQSEADIRRSLDDLQQLGVNLSFDSLKSMVENKGTEPEVKKK